MLEEKFDEARTVDTYPNIVVFLVTETFDESVETGLLPLIDTSYYQNFAKPIIFDNNRCLARIETDAQNMIIGNVVLAGVHFDATHLERCIKEELFNGAGLLYDPIGQASIFTGIEGVANYTEYQEAQMYLLYALPDVSVASYDAYFASHCEQ